MLYPAELRARDLGYLLQDACRSVTARIVHESDTGIGV